MTYEDLLRERIIETVEVSDAEIAELLRVARRDIEASRNFLSMNLDWAFAIAYNSILQLSIAYMNFLGYRPRGQGHHANTFKFMKEILPKEEEATVDRLQKLRKKRNLTIYHQVGLVSEKEARSVIQFAERYYQDTEAKLPKSIVELSRKED